MRKQVMNIVCIPGLGANALVFKPQQAYFAQRLYIPDFLKPKSQESLEAYSLRWAKQIKSNLRQPYVLLGMSLGGMLAQEMAQYLDAKALILLGSLQNPMPKQHLHQWGEKIGQALPNPILKMIRYCSPHWVAWFEGLSQEHKHLLQHMSRQIEIDFYKWQAQAAAAWIKTGFQGEYPCPVFRAHGGRDTVVYLDKELGPEDLFLPKARHLINLSHAQQINAYIEQCIEKVQEP
ncbi:MAG TPA: alpha/beta hydrolase [Oligoflexia bacterium]|nr:alpha/beta hydrolase [Oligoflexia bacterium]